MKKISIIVPVYNKADCLTRCVDSVLAQDQQDFELILVDDGSSDDSLVLCRNYEGQDSRIHVIAKENGGVSTARNAGIDFSCGEYIVFLDADDWWEPDYLNTMISLAEACGNSIMPMCGMYYCEKTPRLVLFSQEAETILREDGIYEIYRKHFLNMLWNKVFLGRIIREHNIRFPQGIHWGEDKLFILDYLKHIHGYHIINRPLYHYDISDDGLNNRFKYDELKLNQMLHQALFNYEAGLKSKNPESHLILCTEYMRVQIEGSMRQIKLSKSPRYAKQLKADKLLADCMRQLHQAGKCSHWLCLCQKTSAFLLIFSYAVKKKWTAAN